MKTRLSSKEWERLSAYLDGQLGERERQQVEEWLRTRPEVREAWQSLRQTQHVLRHARRRKAPRNFTLTPAMVGAPSPRPRSPLVWQLAPALAIFLVIIVVMLEFFPVGSAAPLPRAPLTAAGPMEALQAAQPTATAVIVYWGGPPSPAIGMGGGGAEGMGGMGGGAGDTGVPFKGYAPGTTPSAPPPSQPSPTPAQPLATAEPTPEVRALTAPSPQTLNPILGLPAPEEQGKIYIVTPTLAPESESTPLVPFSFKRLLQGGLLVLAFVLGVAILIRRLRAR
jgi:hypothetical protein